MEQTPMIRDLINDLRTDLPVLIAGPTASGKSGLALAIAEACGGVIVNADASQVYDCWRIISARPSEQEEARAPHSLYGHLPFDAPYSVGHWLREVRPLLAGPRPIIVGGTGLYFAALTEGLADIPKTPPEIRIEGNAQTLDAMIAALDPDTRARIAMDNRARIQRAWEVQRSTGRGLAAWQDDTAPPILAEGRYHGIVLDSPKDWLTPRIETRFDAMLSGGALSEARAMLDRFDANLPSCRAIGAAEAIGVVNGDITHKQAVESATIATRQYAKRQRTWARARMGHWRHVDAQALCED
ncbi:MAG: tRNA (adenosine(37)-N6)-dimethylallyltransferase MiaA [Tateyamaria sp.]|uniref:tRNA (adenosine(37)-N6)-dimethylallyltransferase MiaA n=2 Tax=Tateyamaria sp. TaxID=1929288 RepID=UPI00329ADFFC